MTKEKILILVRAIPAKSKKYGETVCVAGINTNLEWRRLYPFKFLKALSFKKRNVIWAEIEANDKDKRYESRKVIKHWLAQNELVEDKKVKDLLQKIKNRSIAEIDKKGASLGVMTPQIKNIKINIIDTNITEPQLKMLWFGDTVKIGQEELKRLPVEVSYIFTCEEPNDCSCAKKPHELKIIDWEVNELYRNLVKKSIDKKIISEKIKQRFFDWMLKERDLHLILGTHNVFGTWIIIGIFYPKKAF